MGGWDKRQGCGGLHRSSNYGESMSTRRRTLGIYASATPLGPNGERLCRNCQKVLEKGQRHNCSAECSDAWMCKTSPSHLRYRLSERDKGVCASCGLDTVALKKQYAEFCGELKRSWITRFDEMCSKRSWDERQEWLKQYGIPSGRSCSDWWDADHIVPVIEGGGECELSNMRTLCIPCHKAETAALRKRMTLRRIETKALPLFGVPVEPVPTAVPAARIDSQVAGGALPTPDGRGGLKTQESEGEDSDGRH